MLIGTADELPKAPEKPLVFMEDLSEDQAAELISVCILSYYVPISNINMK